MSDDIWIVALALWALASPFFGLLAGWCLARYGHGRCEPRAALNDKQRKLLAVELARTNRMEIKK